MLQKPISRRTLIKALLASGAGVTAASFVPGKWLKPLVTTGVLPVHAQSSLNSGIDGTVYDESRSNPLAGVVVTASLTTTGLPGQGSGLKLASPAARVGSSTSTGINGYYILPLVPGSYFVTMEYGGCGTGANGGSLVKVNPGAFTKVDQDWAATSCTPA
jgi:hypothetical protein